jgi:pyrroline-5-carboxylate reductase
MYNSISIIGAGIIGGAMARILARKKIIERIIATRRDLEKIRDLEKLGVIITRDNKWAAQNSEAILISVKPNQVKDILVEIKEASKGKLIISVAAGIPINVIEEILPESRVVRAMPNLAVLVGESFTVYSLSQKIMQKDREFVDVLFSAMGLAYEVDEQQLNAYTGLTGSGPAYLSTFIEAMVYAGLKVGIPRDVALLGAAQVAIGTGKLIRDGGTHYAKIKEMVVTPAGTTIEGLFELEETGLRRGLMKAVYAATQRAEDISKQHKDSMHK